MQNSLLSGIKVTQSPGKTFDVDWGLLYNDPVLL